MEQTKVTKDSFQEYEMGVVYTVVKKGQQYTGKYIGHLASGTLVFDCGGDRVELPKTRSIYMGDREVELTEDTKIK